LRKKRVIFLTFIACLGRGSMIALLGASAIFLTASQAVINGPRDAFKTCLKEASAKAASDKVPADGYGAYVRDACGAQVSAFKGAVVKFDMGNKMSRNASDSDANDFVDSALETYKYRTGANAATREASAAKPAPAPATLAATPQPIPASQPQPPK
jgi:hypothetical protein